MFSTDHYSYTQYTSAYCVPTCVISYCNLLLLARFRIPVLNKGDPPIDLPSP